VIQAIDTGTPYGAAGVINSAPFVTGKACSTPGIDQAHCYLVPPTSETYFFTSRDAFRTPTVYRTDLSLNFSAKIGPVDVFLQPQVINAFNGQAATFTNNPTAINTSVTVGRGATVNAATGLIRFNPFTTTNPIECPQGAPAATCASLGANWQLSKLFGQPTSGSSAAPSFQLPRTYLVTVGARF
jgi:hypothetical protein